MELKKSNEQIESKTINDKKKMNEYENKSKKRNKQESKESVLIWKMFVVGIRGICWLLFETKRNYDIIYYAK